MPQTSYVALQTGGTNNAADNVLVFNGSGTATTTLTAPDTFNSLLLVGDVDYASCSPKASGITREAILV